MDPGSAPGFTSAGQKNELNWNLSVPQLPPRCAASPGGARTKRLRSYTTLDGITYKTAETREEREGAFRLVYNAYTGSGLMEPNRFRMRVTPFHLLPTTDVFIAQHRGNVIYTMTLISDDFDGLPMQTTYGRELDDQRAQGLYLAEVSCLASRQDYFSSSRMFDVFVQLVGLMFQYCHQNKVDRLVIAVHPRHFRFYKRSLGFLQIGDEKVYASVRNHPAVACQHDFARLEKERYRLYDRIYGYQFQPWELLRQPMLEDDKEYFRPATMLCNGYTPVYAA